MILYAGNILSKFGFTPTFIETSTPKLSEHYDVKAVSDKKNQLYRMIDMMLALFYNKKKIDVVIIDSYSMRAFWYTYILSRISVHYGIPYIPILRGGGYYERLKSSPECCRFVFSKSHKNISPSLFLKNIFVKEGYEVEYIPNFIPVANYKFKKRDSVRPKLLWVRSFDRTYNPVLAVLILKKLKLKYPETELCMVGPDKDGSLQHVTDKAKELEVSDSLKITGRLSKDEWIKLSEDYDIFINTTDYDNHPVSVIEAMALGLPVVSTDVGGIPFLIENNTDGLLVSPDNVDSFTEQIERLISDNTLVQKLSENARNKVKDFDWEILKQKWFNLLDPLIKK